MNIKRCAAFFVAAAAALSLCACGQQAKGADLSIQPAQLTEAETRLAELLAVGMESHRIFDFSMDDSVKTVQLNTYELVDGEWQLLTGGGGAEIASPNGRIALTFGKLTDGVRVAFQTETDSVSTSFTPQPTDDVSGMACTTSVLSEQAPVEYDKDIPLVIQIITSKTDISSYGVKSFDTPAQYLKHGYEHVYAITVRFSQAPLGGTGSTTQPQDSTPPAE